LPVVISHQCTSLHTDSEDDQMIHELHEITLLSENDGDLSAIFQLKLKEVNKRKVLNEHSYLLHEWNLQNMS